MEGPYILACRYTLYNITLNSTLSHLNTSATEEGVIKLPRLSKRSVLLVEDWRTIVLQGIVMYILGSPWFESWPFLAILADDTPLTGAIALALLSTDLPILTSQERSRRYSTLDHYAHR
jgi:hypothetical protein